MTSMCAVCACSYVRTHGRPIAHSLTHTHTHAHTHTHTYTHINTHRALPLRVLTWFFRRFECDTCKTKTDASRKYVHAGAVVAGASTRRFFLSDDCCVMFLARLRCSHQRLLTHMYMFACDALTARALCRVRVIGLPRTLIVHLVRFKFDRNSQSSKINS
jgi:hypothetical protein